MAYTAPEAVFGKSARVTFDWCVLRVNI